MSYNSWLAAGAARVRDFKLFHFALCGVFFYDKSHCNLLTIMFCFVVPTMVILLLVFRLNRVHKIRQSFYVACLSRLELPVIIITFRSVVSRTMSYDISNLSSSIDTRGEKTRLKHTCCLERIPRWEH